MCVCGGGGGANMAQVIPKGGGTYCFWDGSHWCRRQRKTSCPLCNLNTLGNILMILGRNVEQGKATCHGNSGFLTFGVTCLCFV